MPQDHKPQLFNTLREYFGEIEGEREKAAAAGTVKAADGRPDGIADPGGYQGKSTHPSADRSVAEHLRPEQTGSRFSEHTSDVKEDVGAASIENLPEEASSPSKGSGNQDKRQPSIGVRNAATGEDTSVERDFKGTKDDPGTTSVMKADDGEKYGSWTMAKFASFLGDTGEDILADIANGKMGKVAGLGDDLPNGTRKVDNGQGVAPAKKPATADEVKEAAARGYELAAVLGLQDMTPEERTAGMVETIIKEASFQGDLVADFLTGYARTIKQAEGEHPDGGAGEDHSQPGDAASGANDSGALGGGPGAGGPGDGGGGDAAGVLSQLPPEVLQQLIQAVQSGQLGGMGGGDPSGGMGGGGMGGGGMGGGMGGGGMGGGGMGGGDPTGGMGGGGDPQGAMAAMSADGGGGGGGGGMDPSGAAGPVGGDPAADQLSPDQTNDQLAGAMQDMQLTPEQLEGMAGKAAADQRPYLLKIASRVRSHVRSGKYDSTKRASSPAERQLRSEVKGYLAEVVRAV